MSHLTTVAGIGYLSDTETFDADDSEFCDIEIPTTWIPPDATIDALKVRGPENVWAWVDPDTPHVWLPELPIVVRGWQLRQVTPAVSACFGRLVIHASASVIAGSGVAFVGESGAGKSTLAWELLKAGYDLIADDLLPIRFDGTPFIPSSAGPIPLGAVCFLSRGSEHPTLRDIEKVAALDALISNGFGEHQEPTISAVQFDGYHHIADSVPHFDLVVPDDRERLGDTAQRIVSMLGSVLDGASP